MERRIGDRQLLNVVTLFLIAQFGGLLLTVLALPLSQIPAIQSANNAMKLTLKDALILVAEVIILTFVMIYVLKRFKHFISVTLLEAFIVIPGATATFSNIIAVLYPPIDASSDLFAGLAMALLLLAIKKKMPKTRNAVVLLSTIGIGIFFGVLGFTYIYFLMGIIAIYDYVAVFITKHMMTLANLAAEKNLALFVNSSDVQMVPNQYLDSRERNEVMKSGIVKKIKDPTIKRMAQQGSTPYISSIGLGGGDLLLPLMLSISTYVTFFNYFVPIAIIAGSTTGVIVTLMILKRYKVPLPAIPPIFAFENLSLAIIFLVYNPGNPRMVIPFLLVFSAVMLIMLQTLNHNKGKSTQSSRNS